MTNGFHKYDIDLILFGISNRRLLLKVIKSYLLEFDLDVPDGFLGLGDPPGERLLDPVGLLAQVGARPRQRARDEAAQPPARLALVARPPQVRLAEVAPLHRVGLAGGCIVMVR